MIIRALLVTFPVVGFPSAYLHKPFHTVVPTMEHGTAVLNLVLSNNVLSLLQL
jgi:hypothetical protein